MVIDIKGDRVETTILVQIFSHHVRINVFTKRSIQFPSFSLVKVS